MAVSTDLQRDWGRDGEESFIWVDVMLRAGQIRLSILEDLLIDTLETTEPASGYNRMTSRGWSSHARLRDLERKLIRRGKFKLITGVKLDDPIAELYLESVWKGHGKKKRERPEWESEEQWDALEEQEQDVEALEGPDRCEDDELRDGEEGEGWEEEERRPGEEGEE